MKITVVLLISSLLSLSVYADDKKSVGYFGPSHWGEFQKFVLEQEEDNRKLGLSYLISGTVAAVGGTLGYHAADEVFSRAVYAVTANVGIVAIGFGATYYWTSTRDEAFYQAIEGSSLSLIQKNEVLERYLTQQRQERQNRRWIHVATHSLIAAANLYSASRESDADMQSVFYFLGAANAAIAFSYAF